MKQFQHVLKLTKLTKVLRVTYYERIHWMWDLVIMEYISISIT